MLQLYLVCVYLYLCVHLCVCVCVLVCGCLYAVNVPAVVTGVGFFLLGLLCGVVAGVGAVIVYIKCHKETHPPPSQLPPPDPLYEIPTTAKYDVELEQNVAYGNVVLSSIH